MIGVKCAYCDKKHRAGTACREKTRQEGPFADSVKKGAVFSADRVHRTALWRIWDADRPPLAVLALNPSTADEELDDPTIRRCVHFAAREKCGGLVMLNIFSIRSTDPEKLYEIAATPGQGLAHAIGPENDAAILFYTEGRRVLCAWGNHGTLGRRGEEVLKLLEGRDLVCFRITKEGQPEHPLYQPNARPLIPFKDAYRGAPT